MRYRVARREVSGWRCVRGKWDGQEWARRELLQRTRREPQCCRRLKRKNGGRAVSYQKPSNCCSSCARCGVANGAGQEKSREKEPTRSDNSIAGIIRSRTDERGRVMRLMVDAGVSERVRRRRAVFCAERRDCLVAETGRRGRQPGRPGGNVENLSLPVAVKWLSRSPIG